MTTEILALDEISASQSQKEVTHNTALRQIEGRTVRVLDRDGGVVPSTAAAEGDTYIVDSTTGDWNGANLNDIAHFFGGEYEFSAPVEGQRVWVNDEDIVLVWGSSEWVDEIQHRDTQTLGSGSTAIPWNTKLGRYAEVTLGSTVGHTLATPGGMVKGGEYGLIVKQPAGGGLTLAYSTAYKWPGGAAPVISVGANAEDLLRFDSDGNFMFGAFDQNYS